VSLPRPGLVVGSTGGGRDAINGGGGMLVWCVGGSDPLKTWSPGRSGVFEKEERSGRGATWRAANVAGDGGTRGGARSGPKDAIDGAFCRRLPQSSVGLLFDKYMSTAPRAKSSICSISTRCASRMSVVTLFLWQKPGNVTVVDRAKAPTLVRFSDFFHNSYGSWIRSAQASLSSFHGHQSSIVFAAATLKPKPSAMAFPRTGITLRRCVRALPISIILLTRLKVSSDCEISAVCRATMGALFGVDRQMKGPPVRNVDAPGLRAASFYPRAAAAAVKAAVHAAAAEPAA